MEGEKLTREEAEKLLEKWADLLELDTDRQLYIDIVEELRGPVKNNRLTFNEETEEFTYVLLKPVKEKTIVTMKEVDFKTKKILQTYKDSEDMDAAAMLLSRHTNLSVEEVLLLKSRDQIKLNTVVMGFLAQIAPGGN